CACRGSNGFFSGRKRHCCPRILGAAPVRMSPSLLVVDDEVNVARTLQLVFEAQGYRVRVVHSCAEALNIIAARSKFHAVITDLNMERENIGLAVASAAQA